MRGKPERRIKINGEVKNLTEWCTYYGISQGTVYDRVNYRGMTYAEAITRPVRRRAKAEALNDNKKLCRTCMYRGSIGSNMPADLICDYIGYIKHRRPCKAENCTVYVKGNPKRPRNEENKFLKAERGLVWK